MTYPTAPQPTPSPIAATGALPGAAPLDVPRSLTGPTARCRGHRGR